MNVRVRLLGQPRFDDEAGPLRQPRGQKAWALLGRVALADRPMTRSELAAELFPEADDPLGALRWCLADLRRSSQDTQLLRGDPVTLTASSLWLDVLALWDGSLPAADIGGEFLAGVEPRNCPAFDMWLMLARGRCAARSKEELRQAALRSLAVGDAEAAAGLAQRAAALDPLDENAQELFLRALVAAGHPARAAVQLAAEEAERAKDPLLHAEVLRTLGAALVHSVRGFDGEGAVVLHRALSTARAAASPHQAADILRELAFVDVQAGRHTSAARALAEAAALAEAIDDPMLMARNLAVRGMNEADQGHHDTAATLLAASAQAAGSAGGVRQEAWSAGVMARSLLLAGHLDEAREAVERSIELCERDRWNAFLPWPQAFRVHCQIEAGQQGQAIDDAEQAFALACQLGDPCWEGLTGRALALLAMHAGDPAAAQQWVTDARRRNDRVTDRYVWLSGFVGLAQLEIAARQQPDLVLPLARALYQDALRTDLPEFIAWALIYQAEAGEPTGLPLARTIAEQVTNPALRARAAALGELTG